MTCWMILEFSFRYFSFFCSCVDGTNCASDRQYKIETKKEENLTLHLLFSTSSPKKTNWRHLKHIQDQLKVKCLLQKLVKMGVSAKILKIQTKCTEARCIQKRTVIARYFNYETWRGILRLILHNRNFLENFQVLNRKKYRWMGYNY